MKIYCNVCKTNTNHAILYEKKQTENNTEIEIWVDNTYQLIQCKGCDTISFREVLICSEDINSSGEPIAFEHLYPPTNKDTISSKIIYKVPRKIQIIYKEVIDCFNNGNYILCATGIRAVIEGICLDNGIKKGNLVSNIKELHNQGILTSQHSEILNNHRFLGNEAIHQLDRPTKKELELAIEIVEHTLENIYILEEKAYKLKLLRKHRKV